MKAHGVAGWIMLWVFMLGCAATCRAEGDLEKLRRQTREFEWAGVNPNKPVLTQVERWDKELRSDGSWGDIDYGDQAPGFWKTTEHLKRVLAMATLYAVEQTAGRKDDRLKASTLVAAHYWIRHDFHNPNWWHNEIAVPRYMATVLLLVGNEMSAADRKAGLKIAARATISMTGQNRVWKAGIVFRRALVQGNLELAGQARDAILDELKVSGSEGLQVDDSFHQHGPQQQLGNYGLSFAGDMVSWGWIWRGSEFAMPEEKVALLRGFILNGEAMVTTNGMMDISACGRQLFANSERSKGLGVLGLLAAMEQVDQANAEKYRVAGLEDSQAVGGRQATDKDFFRSDYMVHRRAGFYASVKLCSNRVIGGEDTNAENISGRYLADGALFLYRTSREYADVFPVWDWRRVPGVTCMTTGTTLEPAGRMATDFAGGASDGTYGVAGVDYNRDGVSGKKGWFFLDDGVMCLGAGIKGTTGGVRTSIDQRLAEGETVTSGGATGTGINLCKGIRWVLNGTVGYLFAQPQDMSAGVQRQSGTWKDVYAAGAPAAISRDVFSIWIDQAPEDGSYSYMILPGAKVEKLNGYVTHPPVEIVSNTREIQAVRDTTAGVTEILFYKAAELKTENVSMRADEACAVVSRHGRTYVADPTQKEQEVTLTIDGKAVSVTLPRGEMAGSSVRVD